MATEVDESGSTDIFTVVLNAEPTSDVVLTITSDDTGEATVPASVTFTAATGIRHKPSPSPESMMTSLMELSPPQSPSLLTTPTQTTTLTQLLIKLFLLTPLTMMLLGSRLKKPMDPQKLMSLAAPTYSLLF